MPEGMVDLWGGLGLVLGVRVRVKGFAPNLFGGRVRVRVRVRVKVRVKAFAPNLFGGLG